MLRRIFGPTRGVITEEWRIHNEELNDIQCSPNVIRVVKLRRMRTEGHVARMGKRGGVYRVLVGNLWKRDDLENSGVEGRIII